MAETAPQSASSPSGSPSPSPSVAGAAGSGVPTPPMAGGSPFGFGATSSATAEPALGDKGTAALLTTGAGLLLAGLLALVVLATWMVLPRAYGTGCRPADWHDWTFLAAGLALGLVGVALLARGWWRLSDPQCPEPDRSKTLYGRYLIGIGYTLLADGLLNLVALGGLAWSCMLDPVFPLGAATQPAAPDTTPWWRVLGTLLGCSPRESVVLMLLLMISLGMALFGALFFFANALWDKVDTLDRGREAFDKNLFWGGLWFRIGEAFIFTVVLFLVLRLYVGNSMFLLPLLALLVGMFLKSGETLISGLAERVFAAFAQLVPARPAAPSSALAVAFKIGPKPGQTTVTDADLQAVARELQRLRGVLRVTWFSPGDELRVLLDAQVTSGHEIQQQILMLGYTVL